MIAYDPNTPPKPRIWLSIDEMERIELVKTFVEKNETHLTEDRQKNLHASLHAVIENQIAEGRTLPTEAAIARLMDEGLTRHDAIHAAATVLAPILLNPMEADTDSWKAEMEQLTAESWQKMFEEN